MKKNPKKRLKYSFAYIKKNKIFDGIEWVKFRFIIVNCLEIFIREEVLSAN